MTKLNSKFSENARLLLLVNAIVQFVMFSDGVLSYGSGKIRQLELPQKGIGVLVASDETDAAAGGATSIAFNLEFSKTSRSAEIYLVDNIGRIPGFYDQTYKQKVGVQLRRVVRPTPTSNVSVNAYYQWPAAGVRGWSEGVASVDEIFGKSIWIDIAIDRQVFQQPVVQVLDASRHNVLFTGYFNGRADYALRPKVEYRVISDLPFSVTAVLSFIGQDAATRWHEEYARNFSTPPPDVPTIRLRGDELTTPTPLLISTTSKRNVAEPILIQFPEYEATPEDRKATTAPTVIPPSNELGASLAPNPNQALPTTFYENWLPPPTWLLITSGCLLFFLFIVFTGTVLYLCSRRPGFIFVTEEEASQHSHPHQQRRSDPNKTYSESSRSLTPSLSPRPAVMLRYPHHHHGGGSSDDAHGSTSPMMSGSPVDDDSEDHSPRPQTSYRVPPQTTLENRYYSHQASKQQQKRSSLVVNLASNDENDEEFCEAEPLPKRQPVLKFAPSTKR